MGTRMKDTREKGGNPRTQGREQAQDESAADANRSCCCGARASIMRPRGKYTLIVELLTIFKPSEATFSGFCEMKAWTITVGNGTIIFRNLEHKFIETRSLTRICRWDVFSKQDASELYIEIVSDVYIYTRIYCV